MDYLTTGSSFFFKRLADAKTLRPSLEVLVPCDNSVRIAKEYYVREDSRAGYVITSKGELVHQWILDKAYDELYWSAKANGATHGVLIHNLN